MLKRAGGRDHHVGGAVVGHQMVAQPLAVEILDGGARAHDRAPDRLVGERRRLQQLENQVVGRIISRTDLLDDDVLLARQFVRIEAWLRKDIGENVEGERHVRTQHPCVIGGGLDAGGGVEIATNGLNLFSNLARTAAGSALERHVLQKMRDTVLLGSFMPAAGRNPDAERCRLQVRHLVRHHGQSGWETGNLDTHAAAPSRATRLTLEMKFSTTV